MADTSQLIVRAFGSFSISVSDADGNLTSIFSDHKGHSRKLWSLVGYLIFSGKEEVGTDELIEILWPEDEVDNPLASLRLLIHRARANLGRHGPYSGAEMIVSHDKTYSWNRAIPMQTDTDEFDRLYEASRVESLTDRVVSALAAIELYKGPFLQKCGEYQWVMLQDSYYHTRYTAMCEETVRHLKALNRPWGIIALCKQAVAVAPYSEMLHTAFIEALMSVGSNSAALTHYESATEILQNRFGAEPSKRLAETYRRLSRRGGWGRGISRPCSTRLSGRRMPAPSLWITIFSGRRAA